MAASPKPSLVEGKAKTSASATSAGSRSWSTGPSTSGSTPPAAQAASNAAR